MSRGKKGSQAPASVQRDRWGGSGGEREVQVRGRWPGRRSEFSESVSEARRHGTSGVTERRLRISSRSGEENMRSPSQRGRTLLPGAVRLMRNRQDGERGAARVRSVRGRQRRDDSLLDVREARQALKVERTRLRERERVLRQERRETCLPRPTLFGKEVSAGTEAAVISEGARRRSRSGSRSAPVFREARG